MQSIALSPVQNQTFTITLDNNRYEFAVYQTSGTLMCCDISMNGTKLISGQRIVAGQFLIPFFLQAQNGNFLIINQNDQLISYTEFGVTQTLIYMTYDEMLAIVSALPT